MERKVARERGRGDVFRGAGFLFFADCELSTFEETREINFSGGGRSGTKRMGSRVEGLLWPLNGDFDAKDFFPPSVIEEWNRI